MSQRLGRGSRLSIRRAGYLLLGALPLNFVYSGAASAAEGGSGAVEEIVVTGSYIKREKFDMASPVEVISGVEMQETGQVSLGQYIRDLTYTANVDTVANVLDTGDGLQSSDSSRFNLRGLGTTATLTLFDGRRALDSQSFNTLVPDIAMERVEVLLDGGSALYGTDAIAGVVNIIPVKKYDGFKVTALHNQDEGGDFHETQAQMLGGASFGDLDVVGAFSYTEKTALLRSERPEYLRADTDESTSGNPGSFLRVGSTTPLPGSGVDPSCGTFNGGNTDDGRAGAFPSGRQIGTSCIFDFGEFQDYARPGEEYNGYTNLTYALNDSVSLELQANFIYRVSDVVISPSTAGTLNHRFLNIPANHPANPYGVVVRPNNWRPFTRLGTLPSHLEDGGYEITPFSYWTDRYKIGSTYKFGDSTWTGETWASLQTWRTDNDVHRLSYSRLQAALNGQGGPNGNQWFNPFGSADPRSPFYVAGVTNNTQALVDWLYIPEKYESRRDQFWYVESIVTGDLFTWPMGTVKAAGGVQVRETHSQTSPTRSAMNRDDYITSVADDPPAKTNTHNEVRSVFAEIDVPLLSSLDLTVAIRHEDFKDLGLDATKPKFSLRYTPFDSLALRASYGESFLAPRPDQVLVTRQTGCGELFTGNDPFRVTALGSLTGARQCTTGNAALQPEEAEIMNFGFTWQPQNALNGLELSVDYQNIKYDGRITQLSSQDLVDRDFVGFAAAVLTPAGISVAQYQSTAYTVAQRQALASAWFNGGGMDPLIRRDATLFSVLTLDRPWANVAALEIGLVDFRTRYRFDAGNVGFFSANWSTTYYDKYEYNSTPTAPTIDASGKQNANTTIVPPIPEFRHNLRLDWSRGAHTAMINTQHIDSIKFDSTANNVALTGMVSPTEIDSLTTVDIRYSYTFENLMGGKMLVAVGSNNVFDEGPDPLPVNGGFESRLHDPFGRTMYLELQYDF
jgi:iron complex outermembrane recepter protein